MKWLKAKSWIIVATACLIAACVSEKPHVVDPYSNKTLSGLSVEVTEHAHDGKYTLLPEKPAKADANSTLVVQFDVPKLDKVQDGLPNARWQRVTGMLGRTEDLAKSRATLNAVEVDLNSSEQVTQLKKRAQAEDKKIIDLYSDLEQLGLDQKTIRSILSGGFDGRVARTEPYANLARWLRVEIEALERAALDFTRAKEKLRVTVQALHEPLVGDTKYLHIEDYDSLPEGEYRPIDRYGLNLTEAEKQRFKVEYKQAALARNSIQEISAHGKTIKEAGKKWISDIETNIQELKNSLSEEPGGIVGAAEQIIKKLEAAIADSKVSLTEKTKAAETIRDLKDLKQDIDLIHSLISKLEAISQLIRNPGNLDLENFASAGGFIDKLQEFSSDLRKVLEKSKEWTPKLEKLTGAFGGLGRIVTPQEINQLAGQPTQDFLATLSKDLPKTAEAITVISDILRTNSGISKGAETLAETDQKTIPHTLDNLVPARVELPKAGLTLGDHVTVKVKLTSVGADGSQVGPTAESLNYRTEAVLTGLHRRIGADLIFARGFGSDDARKWRPNVAARGEWHYLIREPNGRWEAFWNWLDPGLGLHAASLNQGPESIQVGLGGNLSLWNNFVSVGYGHNLSVNRQYVFVGINLLNVLNKAKGALGE